MDNNKSFSRENDMRRMAGIPLREKTNTIKEKIPTYSSWNDEDNFLKMTTGTSNDNNIYNHWSDDGYISNKDDFRVNTAPTHEEIKYARHITLEDFKDMYYKKCQEVSLNENFHKERAEALKKYEEKKATVIGNIIKSSDTFTKELEDIQQRNLFTIISRVTRNNVVHFPHTEMNTLKSETYATMEKTIAEFFKKTKGDLEELLEYKLRITDVQK